jgi:serine/threonine protein kinase/formylglycine-generating enzyme required for sulfatase activity
MRIAKCPKCGHRLDFDSAVGERLTCSGCGVTLKVPGKSKASSESQIPTQFASRPPPGDPLIGVTLREFEVQELLGRGGMGAVYKGVQPSLGRPVAIKVLPKKLAEDSSFVERFRREGRAAAAISHPHIIEVFSVGEDKGHQFIAMEFIDGEGLDQVLKRERHLSPDRALELMKQVADALARAHAHGILHRDIKPANILIDKYGSAKVADFGLAKQTDTDVSITVTGQTLGTPLYIPPEAARGQHPDARADIYSLGATFYQALAGRPPFQGTSASELIIKHVEQRVPPLQQLAPDAPPALCRVIHRCLRKAPAQRYQDASQLLEALQRVEARLATSEAERTQAKPVTHHPSAEDRQAAKKKAKRRNIVLAGSIGSALLLALVLLLTLGGGKDTEPQAKGQRLAQPPSAVTKADGASDTPPASRLEANAETVFNNARLCVERQDWQKARHYLGRLTTKYGDTKFAAAHKSAIAALQQQMDAYVKGGAKPKTSEPQPPQPGTQHPGPPHAPQADDERWTEWQDLFDGTTLENWKVRICGAHKPAMQFKGQEPRTVDGGIAMGYPDKLAYLEWAGQFPSVDYEVAFEAKCVAGELGFACCTFPFRGSTGCFVCSLSRVGLQRVDGEHIDNNPTAKQIDLRRGTWYRVWLRVTGARIEAWIDSTKVVDFRPSGRELSPIGQLASARGFGVYCWMTKASYRNIRLRRLKTEGATPTPHEKPEPPTPAETEAPQVDAEAAEKAIAAYAEQSDKLWALLRERQYGEAAKRIAEAKARPELKLAAEHVQADAEALKLLEEFWSAVEKGMAGLKGRTMFIGGAGGALVGVQGGVITIRTPRGELKTGSVRDLAAKQAAAYSGLADQADARSQLALGVFLLAEGAELDEAEAALGKAGDAPSVAIYQERLSILTLGAAEAAAKKAWLRIQDAAKRRLTPATAGRLASLLAAFEKAHGSTNLYKGLGEKLAAVRHRIEDSLGYTKWPFDEKEAKRRQKATADALGVKVEQDIDLGNGVKMTFVLIPAGEFLMGSPASTSPEQLHKLYGGNLDWYQREFPQHRVKISKPFWLGKTEVTQEQWEAVMGNNRSKFAGRPKNPVEQVSWNHCQGFLKKLTAKFKKPFRLPTEAEWEYACRAGTPTQFYFGDSQATLPQHAWFNSNSSGSTQPVGSKKPNAWGLHDMAGNVREWCEDWFGADYYGSSPALDPRGPTEGRYRVVRGGGWNYYPYLCRSAARFWNPPAFAGSNFGFRVVVSVAARASD